MHRVLRRKEPLQIGREAVSLRFLPFISKYPSFHSGCFSFLNVSQPFEGDLKSIDWEYKRYGKLWDYNLNYFDYLFQPGMTKECGLELIDSFISSLSRNNVGLDSYPISLRGVNWVKFLSRYGIQDVAINGSLYAQYMILERNLEYHLLGNHLLENAFSLLFGACYFGEQKWYDKSRRLLLRELDEQILDDGAHFELSPMYHRMLLDRLFDCINLLQNNPCFKQQAELLCLLTEKAGEMFCWLNLMTFSNGRTPHLNDATDGVAPATAELCAYAERLGLHTAARACPQLSGSGYRRFEGRLYECIVDVGQIGPDYMPGHAHADTFNFVMNVNDEPLIVDTGISTYEKSPRRDEERSTKAHNTVVVNGMNSSDVWSGFRVGHRARVKLLEDNRGRVKAVHDGCRALGVECCREWNFFDDEIVIVDSLGGCADSARAYFHFDHRLDVKLRGTVVEVGSIAVAFEGVIDVWAEFYEQARGYNDIVEAVCVVASFNDRLTTTIQLGFH